MDSPFCVVVSTQEMHVPPCRRSRVVPASGFHIELRDSVFEGSRRPPADGHAHPLWLEYPYSSTGAAHRQRLAGDQDIGCST